MAGANKGYGYSRMVRMDKLLDAWRADPRVEPTVELCAMLTRASLKPGARDVIPPAFIAALAAEAIVKHPRSIEVFVALASLFHAAGETKRAAGLVEKALIISPDDPRVTALATRWKLQRSTRELVSDPTTTSASTPPPASARPTGGASPSSPPTRVASSSAAPPGVGPLDAETFDAPTTPLDPPTEPAARTGAQALGAAMASHPRRALTTHGLGGVAPPAPTAAAAPAASPPPAPPAATPATTSNAVTSKGPSPPDLTNPRRSRTLLGAGGPLPENKAPPAAPAVVPPAIARPPAQPPSSHRLDAPDSDGDQATGVMSAGLDDGPPTTVDRVFPGGRDEPKTQQRDVPQIPSRPPASKGPASVRGPTLSTSDGDPPTRQRDVGDLPPLEGQTALREVPRIPPRAPAPKPAEPPRIAPLATPSQQTAVAPPRHAPDSDPGTSTRVAPAPDSRPAARRLAARKPPAARGVGTDDPLMKAALARRQQGAAALEADPKTHAEHDVPTKIGKIGKPEDGPPTRSIGKGDDGPPTRTVSTSMPAPLPRDEPDDPESAPTHARDLSELAPPARPIVAGLLAAPETTQTEVDSVSEDAPTRTLSAPPPVALPPLKGVRLSESQESPAAQGEGASTFSKVVTTVFKQAGRTPPPPPAWAPSSPGAQQGDDSVDTQLRPLAPLAPPMRRPSLPEQAAPSFGAPPVARSATPPPLSITPAPLPATQEPEEDNPGTYVMKPAEAFAASRVDPRAPVGVGAPPVATIDPADVIEEPSHSGASIPMAPAFGPPPASVVTRGVAFGAGAQGADAFRPTMPLDFQLEGEAAAPLSLGRPAFGEGGPGAGRGGLDGGLEAPLDPYGRPLDLLGSVGRPPALDPSPFDAARPFDAQQGSDPAQGFDPPQSFDPQRGFDAPPRFDAPYDPQGHDPQGVGGRFDASAPSSAYGLEAPRGGPNGFGAGGYGGGALSGASRVPPPLLDAAALQAPEGPRRPVGLYLALGMAAVMVATLVGYASYLVISDYRRADVAQVARPTTEVEKAILSGSPSDLAHAEALFTDLDKTPSKEVALAKVRFRVVRMLEQAGTDPDLGAALDAARAAGVGTDAACGEVALALSQKNAARVDEIIAKEDAGLGKDAYYQLAVGVALEERGDVKAIERYEAAIAAEPRLTPARIRAIRALLLEGDLPEAEKRLAELPDSPSKVALQALAWAAGRAGGLPETVARPKTLPTTAEVGRELVPAYAATSLLDAEKGDASALTKRGIDESDAPGVAVLFGRIALERGDVTGALAAARAALTVGPRYAPASKLLGRTALEQGKFDAMMQVVATLPEDVTRELRSIRAYELSDLDELSAISTKVEEADPAKFVVSARFERLRGVAPLSDAQIGRLLTSEALGAELCAVDALLDKGDLAKAKEVIGQWSDATTQPLRAKRYARLMRYEGNLDEALLALGGATTTAGTATMERMIVAAEIPKHRKEVLDLLAQRPSPLEVPAATARLLEGYIRARDDDMRIAKDILDGATIPSKQTALPTRMCAALAFGEVKDKRAEGLVRELYASFPKNPDVLRAAVALGIADAPKP